jgi:hypothetical protein
LLMFELPWGATVVALRRSLTVAPAERVAVYAQILKCGAAVFEAEKESGQCVNSAHSFSDRSAKATLPTSRFEI